MFVSKFTILPVKRNLIHTIPMTHDIKQPRSQIEPVGKWRQ